MPRWTTGPWRVAIVKGSYKRPAMVLAGDKLVASCMGDQLDPDATSIGEATANAQLIAAAPDLYELVAAFRDTVGSLLEGETADHWVTACDQVLARAERDAP
jgi:hypothetical protein